MQIARSSRKIDSPTARPAPRTDRRAEPATPRRSLDFATRLFTAVGVPEADASVVASNLIGANLRGHDSHGVLRIPQYVDFLRKGDYRIGVDLEVENESPGVVVVDGQWGLGQVQAHRLLDLVIPKAKDLGPGRRDRAGTSATSAGWASTPSGPPPRA